MARFLVLTAFLFTVLVGAAAVPSASAAATPTFFETTVIEDTEGDYAGLPREFADIEAVYLSEKFSFDPEKRILKGNYLVFRIDLFSTGAPPCQSTAQYDIHFTVDGVEKVVSAVVTTDSPASQQNPCGRIPGQGGSANVQFLSDSLIIAVPSADYGVVAGSVLADFWATSSTTGGPNPVVHDTAPEDNANSPSGSASKPDGTLLSYNAVGVFPFIRVVPLTPLDQYSVNGGEIEYAFQFFSHEQISNDNIRVRFDIPEGWTLSPSRGTTGADPEGQLSGGSAGSPVEFTFTASATGIVNEGDVSEIIMHVITDAGGYEKITTRTTVSGTKITDPNLTFDLASKGPFKAEEESTIRFSAAHPTIDLAGQALSIDVFQGTRRITTLTAKDVGAGVYEVVYSFPSEGEYRLDVYISSMKPSPHQEFTVSVEKGGLAPGPGFLTILFVGLLGVAGYLRRNR